MGINCESGTMLALSMYYFNSDKDSVTLDEYSSFTNLKI